MRYFRENPPERIRAAIEPLDASGKLEIGVAFTRVIIESINYFFSDERFESLVLVAYFRLKH